jgi:LysR family glycine cleavage system transcriptional activator
MSFCAGAQQVSASNLALDDKLCLKYSMSRRLPPIESLRVLEACVRHSSFTRAASEMGITPAAVSLRMRNLEAELGKKLFVRSGPKLEPTPDAVALAGSLAEALSMMQAAVTECRRSAQPLRLTAVPSFAARWLAPRLARYHLRPDATPIQVDVSSELRAASEFDMAIRTGCGNWPGFGLTRLAPVGLAPMLSPALAATVRLASPSDLYNLPLLPHEDWPLWFRHVGVRSRRAHFCAAEYPTYELDAMAAVEGAGVALLPPMLFVSLVREGKLIQPFGELLSGPSWHYLLLQPGETRRPVHDFRAWLQEEIRACTVAARGG